MVRLFWFARTEIFQNKRNVLKGSPKFPNGISERKMCLPFAIRNQFQAIRQFLSASLWLFTIYMGKPVGRWFVQMESKIPIGNFRLG